MIRASILVGSTAAVISCNSARTAREACSPPDAGSMHFQGVIRATVSEERSRNLFRLPQVALGEIRPASEPGVCMQAERVLASMKSVPGKRSRHRVYVFHIGTSYAIGEETPEQDGDVIYFFDPEWHVLSNAIAQ